MLLAAALAAGSPLGRPARADLVGPALEAGHTCLHGLLLSLARHEQGMYIIA